LLRILARAILTHDHHHARTGSEIIIPRSAKAGEINPTVAGKRMQAIFGFAILNHFNDCTDALQEDVMLYVNRVRYVRYALCLQEDVMALGLGTRLT
jgi:hypothetical protein